MRSIFTVFFFLLCFLPSMGGADSSSAAVQTSGSWGVEGPYQRLYKSGKPARIEGRVMRTEEIVPLPGMEPGVQLRIEGKKQDVLVHLGPRWFVMDRDFLFTKGEPVVVVGVTIRLGENKSALVADEIRRGDRKVVLRELSGVPVWEKAHQVPQ